MLTFLQMNKHKVASPIQFKFYLKIIALLPVFFCGACYNEAGQSSQSSRQGVAAALVLGTVQDGGSPHIACAKPCCAGLYMHPDYTRKVVSIGLKDKFGHMALLEASPDIATQLFEFNRFVGADSLRMPDAVLLSHAHIGHYSGLMYFGREAAGAKQVRVYALPRMKNYLQSNGPWSQLCALENIKIDSLQFDQKIQVLNNIWVTAIQVPHRDEFSETAGYIVEGPKRKLLFIPDIDKWQKWNRSIIEEIKKVDYALIDGTFYDSTEVAHRNKAEIPHPFVVESIKLFKDLSASEKRKIYFIHFNHTNPLLNKASAAYYNLTSDGFRVAGFGETLEL